MSTPQPPAVRQLHGPVAAGLVGVPAADPPALAEQAEGSRSARRTSRGCPGWRRGSGAAAPSRAAPPARAFEAPLVAVGAGRRVDLVAPEHEDVPRGSARSSPSGRPPGAPPPRPPWRWPRTRRRCRPRSRSTPRRGRVAQVRVRRAARLQLALVEERPEHRGTPTCRPEAVRTPGLNHCTAGWGEPRSSRGRERRGPGRGHVAGDGVHRHSLATTGPVR